MAEGVAPDVRDGLTPVGRRALLALAASSAAFVDCTRTLDAVVCTGRVDGGRRAIHAELVRMARDWEMRHPLVDAQGDLGSLDGDGAARPDYLRMRLGALGDELLRELGEEVEELGQPAPDTARGDGSRALPARVPNLLVNGSYGVATGAASRIPPHNLREVIDAVIVYIGDRAIDTAGLMGHILGPDFPTGAVVLAGAELHDVYAAGHGSIRARARSHIEPGPLPPRAIVVTELPFMVSKGGRGGVLAELRRATRSRKVSGVHALHDESSEARGLRIVIQLEPDASADIVLEQLYEHTRLQTTFELRLVANVAGQAQTIGLRDAIAHYVEHRRDVVARRTGLRSEQRVLDVVRRDLLDIAATHGDERRTEIC